MSTRHFEDLAHRQPRHAGLWHRLGEVEVVFGFWAPVLVVAATWQGDLAFTATTFGAKAAAALACHAAVATLRFRRELAVTAATSPAAQPRGPGGIVAAPLLFLGGVVVFAHHPPPFMGLFLYFPAFAAAYARHQHPLILREALLVAFFLAGLVVLGGHQRWWLRPVLLGLDAHMMFFGATALTYLGSLVPGLSEDCKVALLAAPPPTPVAMAAFRLP